MKTELIFIDDDPDLQAALRQGLELAGFKVKAFSDGPEALRHIRPDYEGVVLSDVRMPNMDGFAVFRRIQAIDPDLPILLLTGHGDVSMAVQAMKEGVYDFLTKPFSMDELALCLRRALQQRRLVLENRRLRQIQTHPVASRVQLVGESDVMRDLRHLTAQVAETDIDILITGETGTGKETVARLVHQLSSRHGRAFVQISCSAVQGDQYQIELFGQDPPVRTNPLSRRSIGRVEKAHKGILFLEDVDALSLSQQAQLLRTIESGELWPLGADEPRQVDLRVLAATRIDLTELVQQGRFRADLFYRLSRVTLHVPPLTERQDDIGPLFQHFLVRACARMKRPLPEVSPALLAWLHSHKWPGNVRELEHTAERLALGVSVHLPTGEQDGATLQSLTERVAAYEATLIRESLRANHGNAQAAIQSLKIARKTFYDKLKKYDISVKAFRT